MRYNSGDYSGLNHCKSPNFNMHITKWNTIHDWAKELAPEGQEQFFKDILSSNVWLFLPDKIKQQLILVNIHTGRQQPYSPEVERDYGQYILVENTSQLNLTLALKLADHYKIRDLYYKYSSLFNFNLTTVVPIMEELREIIARSKTEPVKTSRFWKELTFTFSVFEHLGHKKLTTDKNTEIKPSEWPWLFDTMILPKIRPITWLGHRPNFGRKTAYVFSISNGASE